ncbi:hypothetical protein [Longimicrobium sp.]|uniref:hypothetical protein n=1 Tax=Longimicrobium sp. TaxID=2029185 RepID=UPI002E32270E|nr:hypothetical protein [Longimicrobium sp.]HEX6039097.1 hypothetical protein [Longimicrobium sp.]
MSYHLTPDPRAPGSYRVSHGEHHPGEFRFLFLHGSGFLAAAAVGFGLFYLGMHPVFAFLCSVGAYPPVHIAINRMNRLARAFGFALLYMAAAFWLLEQVGVEDWIWIGAIETLIGGVVGTLGYKYDEFREAFAFPDPAPSDLPAPGILAGTGWFCRISAILILVGMLAEIVLGLGMDGFDSLAILARELPLGAVPAALLWGASRWLFRKASAARIAAASLA